MKLKKIRILKLVKKCLEIIKKEKFNIFVIITSMKVCCFVRKHRLKVSQTIHKFTITPMKVVKVEFEQKLYNRKSL